MRRRVDYGRVALTLTIVIIGIFALDFCRRAFHLWNGEEGALVVQTSSQVDSQTSSPDSPNPDASSVVEPPAVTTPTQNFHTVEMLASEVHTGSLILVNNEHPLAATPTCTPFSAIAYDHFRLPSKALTISNTMITPLVTMFQDFFTATKLGNVMIYATTTPPTSAAYGATIPERATGLCVDLAVWDDTKKTHSVFSGAGEYAWLTTHCVEYGFMVRFPAANAADTGQPAVPWHFRYVGIPHAAYMTEHNLCLETYLAEIQTHTWEGEHLQMTVQGKQYEVYYVPVNHSETMTVIPFPKNAEAQVSGDNMDGFIVTCAMPTNG